MKNHKRIGFTVVELIVIITVIAVLVSISAVAYRSTQADARDKKRTADVLMLKAAVEEYYADKGDYPLPSAGCTSPGNYSECWRNETWQLLVDQGYLTKIPQPDMPSPSSSHNINNSNVNYGWYRYTATSYAIYTPLESHPSRHCKTGRNMQSWMLQSAPSCDF